jgi:hypothetical protein
METTTLDWLAGALAIAIVIGGLLMMFTNLWTQR